MVKEKNGRRNRYHIQAHLRLPEPDGRERTVGEILALLTGTDAPATRQGARAPAFQAGGVSRSGGAVAVFGGPALDQDGRTYRRG